MSADAQTELHRHAMLRDQLQRRGIHDRGVLAAMQRVPRERFIAPALSGLAYADRALAIDCGQTISQPYMVALMTESLELTGRQRVLEIGTGSGYQTAILAELAQQVISIERHAELQRKAGDVLAQLGYDHVRLVVGDGTLGYASEAPFDRILVTAGAVQCPPALIEQLDDNGILVIPLGGGEGQVLQRLVKRDGHLDWQHLVSCRFVPLVGATGDA
ncbi:MAG TPA: protein-L-isoaspartate(D-aspartate) O-methyltransferase [Pirellulales bacterium]